MPLIQLTAYMAKMVVVMLMIITLMTRLPLFLILLWLLVPTSVLATTSTRKDNALGRAECYANLVLAGFDVSYC